jgi:hypothetical protein
VSAAQWWFLAGGVAGFGLAFALLFLAFYVDLRRAEAKYDRRAAKLAELEARKQAALRRLLDDIATHPEGRNAPPIS